MDVFPTILPLAQDGAALAPLPAWALIAALGSGMVLWLLGHKALKLCFGLLGVITGGFAGLALPAALGATLAPALTGTVGAAVGLMIALATFRVSIGITLALVLGIAGTLAVFSFVAPREARELRDQPLSSGARSGEGPELTVTLDPDTPPGEPSDQAVADVKRWLIDHAARDGSPPDAPGAVADSVRTLREGAELVRDRSHRFADRVRPVWNDLPREDRTAIALGAVGGAAVGLGFGLLFPRRSASVVTSCAGTLLWLPAAVELSRRSGVRLPVLTDGGSLAWLLALGMACVIGTWIQWRLSRPKVDKA